GVKHLSSLLEDPNCKLEKLDLSDCSIGEEGFRSLTSAVRSNPSALRKIHLGNNLFSFSKNDSGPSVQQLISKLKKDPNCKHIKISGPK
ncbi:hypothetical protein DKP78_17715, partial [Enterococcus faecium]